MNIEDLIISFVVCLIFSGIGMIKAIKVKSIKREKIAHLAVWIFLGFAAFLLDLAVISIGMNLLYFDEIIVSTIFGYLMADASIFSEKG